MNAFFRSAKFIIISYIQAFPYLAACKLLPRLAAVENYEADFLSLFNY